MKALLSALIFVGIFLLLRAAVILIVALWRSAIKPYRGGGQ